ncbi:hypothetical protein JB92DRAFT_3104483 [Gautieria morchelliformis]|nr:hypothetical protein JB92DRAFT_3104483 [Gautieria morchelliformis]
MSSAATMRPGDLPVPSPSYASVAAAARNSDPQESSGENTTLEKLKNSATTVKSVVSTAVVTPGGTDATTQKIGTFAETSAVLMNALDGVAQLHPFIGVAVLTFKTVWTLEMKRRQKNTKIEALHKEMSDMMGVLLQLQDQDPKPIGHDGKTIQDRMQNLVEDTAKDIEKCANVLKENETLLIQLGKRELKGVANRDLREDLRADPEEAIQKNMVVFARKIEVQQSRIVEETKATVRREGDRVVEAIGARPHDRIIDPDIHILWKETGWRGSVKSRYFVMTLRDYYHDKWGSEVQAAKESDAPSAAVNPNSNGWALA